MDPRHDLRARLAKSKAERIESRHKDAEAKAAPLLEDVACHTVALRLMGECVSTDPLLHLVKQHVQRGFAIPKKVADEVRRRLDGEIVGGYIDRQDVYELLKVATLGLKGKDRSFAFSLLTRYETSEWSDEQFFWAQRCLENSRNGVRKVI
jgi:hypothetical protein